VRMTEEGGRELVRRRMEKERERGSEEDGEE
jgi:ribosomal protein L34